jgi:hypothetical protein
MMTLEQKLEEAAHTALSDLQEVLDDPAGLSPEEQLFAASEFVGYFTALLDFMAEPVEKDTIHKFAVALAHVADEPSWPLWAPGWCVLAHRMDTAADVHDERVEGDEPESTDPAHLGVVVDDMLSTTMSGIRHWEFQEHGMRRTTLGLALGRLVAYYFVWAKAGHSPRAFDVRPVVGSGSVKPDGNPYERLVGWAAMRGVLSTGTATILEEGGFFGDDPRFRAEDTPKQPPAGLLTADEEQLLEGIARAYASAPSPNEPAPKGEPSDVSPKSEAMELPWELQSLLPNPAPPMYPKGAPTDEGEVLRLVTLAFRAGFQLGSSRR